MVKRCMHPFDIVRIFYNGDVIFCCWSSNYVIGNIFEDSFENIWNGKKAQEFRKSVLDGSYKYCPSSCVKFRQREVYERDNFEYPEVVGLAYNKFCNVRCKMCRDKLICETKEDTERQEKYIEKVVDICKNAKNVFLNGEGEALSSPHFRKLIKILAETYPNLTFSIISNGLLLRKDILRDLCIVDRLNYTLISLHAATKETYNKVVAGSNFDTILSNIKYLSKKTVINFAFVVSSLNYKEMPAFLKMASKFNALTTFSLFAPFHSSTSTMCREHEKYECFNPKHPEYKKFLKVLKKTVRLAKKNNYKCLFQDTCLLNLVKSVDKASWWEKLFLK